MSCDAEIAIARLLESRGAGRTICPSEAARELAGEDGDWRARMHAVHKAIDTMLDTGAVELSWKGERLSRRRGAYRIARRLT